MGCERAFRLLPVGDTRVYGVGSKRRLCKPVVKHRSNKAAKNKRWLDVSGLEVFALERHEVIELVLQGGVDRNNVWTFSSSIGPSHADAAGLRIGTLHAQILHVPQLAVQDVLSLESSFV